MEDKPVRKTKDKIIYTAMFIVLFSVGIVILLYFLSRGQVITTSLPTDNEYNISMNCTKTNFTYPFFEYNENIKSETSVNIIFNSTNKLSSISLAQISYYPDTDSARKSEAINHASMNKNFGSMLGPDALNINYHISENIMRMQIYADSSQYTTAAKKFFLTESSSKDVDSFKKNFENLGFKCTQKNN